MSILKKLAVVSLAGLAVWKATQAPAKGKTAKAPKANASPTKTAAAKVESKTAAPKKRRSSKRRAPAAAKTA